MESNHAPQKTGLPRIFTQFYLSECYFSDGALPDVAIGSGSWLFIVCLALNCVYSGLLLTIPLT